MRPHACLSMLHSRASAGSLTRLRHKLRSWVSGRQDAGGVHAADTSARVQVSLKQQSIDLDLLAAPPVSQ